MSIKTHYLHPGRVIALEFMEPYGLTMYRLAKLLEVPETRVNRLIRGDTSITPDTAKRLSRLFGMEEQYWMNLQSHYDLATADVSEKQLKAVEAHRSELQLAA